jgi:hypothetical protein
MGLEDNTEAIGVPAGAMDARVSAPRPAPGTGPRGVAAATAAAVWVASFLGGIVLTAVVPAALRDEGAPSPATSAVAETTGTASGEVEVTAAGDGAVVSPDGAANVPTAAAPPPTTAPPRSVPAAITPAPAESSAPGAPARDHEDDDDSSGRGRRNGRGNGGGDEGSDD